MNNNYKKTVWGFDCKVCFLFQIVLKLTGDMFEVELPDGHEIQFPNRVDMAAIDYVKITGDIRVTCIKIC